MVVEQRVDLRFMEARVTAAECHVDQQQTENEGERAERHVYVYVYVYVENIPY